MRRDVVRAGGGGGGGGLALDSLLRPCPLVCEDDVDNEETELSLPRKREGGGGGGGGKENDGGEGCGLCTS